MKATASDKVFYTVNGILLFIIGVICLFPLLNILATSLSSSRAIMSGNVSIWPVELSYDNFKLLLDGTPILSAFNNSVVITVFGVIFSMVATIMAAYPLSRKYFYARKFFTFLLVFTMLFGGGLIPTYLLVTSLGLVNNYGALWFLSLVSTYNMLVMRTYFMSIPDEMEEAARIDGCSELRLLVQIILPLSKPVLAALSLFYGVGYWNMFMSVLIYINDTGKYNLAVLVQQMIRNQAVLDPNYIPPDIVQQMTPEGVRAAGIVVMVLPMLVVYPFVQKYFVKGVMLGSVKG